MSPWGTRQTLHVKGRQGAAVTIVVEVYRRKVWLTVIDVPFVAEGILEPGQAENVAELLVRAASEARGKKTQKTAEKQQGTEEDWESATDRADARDAAP